MESPNSFKRHLVSASVLASALSIASAYAAGLPTGGHYVAGQGSINKAGASVTVRQSSTTGVINWNSFSIRSRNSVAFDNGNGATLNRVTGENLSRVAGSLHATGSLYLMNGAGVIISGSGRVVTGGSFVASSGSISDDAFDERLFRGAKASVINRGSIVSGGDTQLVGGSARNAGTIRAANASLRAESGTARDTGTIRAGGTAARAGRILVIASSGKTKIAGDLIAKGGTIETSGRSISVAGTVNAGEGGSWLIDPKNLTVTASAAKTIDKSLNKGTSVTLKTTKTGTSGPGTQSSGPGDILIDAALTWSGKADLTLDAYHSVIVEQAITSTGAGDLTLAADTAAADAGTVTFSGTGSVNFSGGTGDVTIYYHPSSYKDPTNYGSAVTGHSGSTLKAYMTVDNAIDLQALKGNLGGAYALNANIDASSIANFTPIGSGGSNSTEFRGTLDGRGYTISNLTIERDTTFVGLFGELGKAAHVRDLHLTGVEISGMNDQLGVGALAGKNEGHIAKVTVSGSVEGAGDYIGGLVGDNGGTGVIASSHTATTIVDNDTAGVFAYVGGLVGVNYHSISHSYATKSVTELAGSESDIGGLVGWNDGGSISSSHALGDVTTNSSGDFDDVGGLVGESGYTGTSTISSSHASGAVSGGGESANVGGLVGVLVETSSVTNSHASGSATGAGQYAFVGGLVGDVTDAGTISDSQASGDVTGGLDSYDGGLVGSDILGAVTGSTATGSVTGGAGSCTGPVIGYPNGDQAGCE